MRAAGYAERLTVPLRWWVQATMLLATVWLAFVVALPFWLASALVGGLLAGVYLFFLRLGSARLAVDAQTLVAGRATIGLEYLGSCRVLDAEAARRVHGVEADARAYLLTRPYLKRAVQITIDDPADPTPYWLLSTRHPDRLAAALSLPAGSP